MHPNHEGGDTPALPEEFPHSPKPLSKGKREEIESSDASLPSTVQAEQDIIIARPPILPGDYRLIIRQEPGVAPHIWGGKLDRRFYISPPPIFRLTIRDPDRLGVDEARERLRSPHLVVRCTISEDGDHDGVLTGMTDSSPFVGQDLSGQEACFFCFSALSCWFPGNYRLCFELSESSLPGTRAGDASPILARAISKPFTVFKPKDFPGKFDMTALTETLLEQGCPSLIKRGKPKRLPNPPADASSTSDGAPYEHLLAPIYRIRHSRKRYLTHKSGPGQSSVGEDGPFGDRGLDQGSSGSPSSDDVRSDRTTTSDDSAFGTALAESFGQATAAIIAHLVDGILSRVWARLRQASNPTPSGEAESGIQNDTILHDTVGASGGHSGTSDRTRPPKRSLRRDADGGDADGGDASDSEEEEEPPKKKAKPDQQEPGFLRRFACPYFKRNPQKYGGQRSCYGAGWASVHRIKEHLYRRHAQYVCFRCSHSFKAKDDLRSHQQTEEPCERRPRQVVEDDGFDEDQEKLLRCRRKQGGKTEETKWLEMFRILFPSVPENEVPSPYIVVVNLHDAGSGREELASSLLGQAEPLAAQIQQRIMAESLLTEQLRTRIPHIVREAVWESLEDFTRRFLRPVPQPEAEGERPRGQPLLTPAAQEAANAEPSGLGHPSPRPVDCDPSTISPVPAPADVSHGTHNSSHLALPPGIYHRRDLDPPTTSRPPPAQLPFADAFDMLEPDAFLVTSVSRQA